MKFSIFATEKNLYILHGHVFVMSQTLVLRFVHRGGGGHQGSQLTFSQGDKYSKECLGVS